MASVFVELSIILLLVIIFSTLMRVLRQPLIIGYILAGIAASPVFLNVLTSHESFSIFSQIGISILLFIVGLSLNPQVIREVGLISLLTGIGQVLFTTLAGYGILIWLGYSPLTSLYVSLALAFSSTIIIMKLFSDKGELETLHGRISIGFLLVQDLIAIMLMILLSSWGGVDEPVSFPAIALQGFGILLILLFLSIWLLPKLLEKIAASQEYLMLFAISWCFSLASIFYFLGLSIEIGSLLAGITLASSSYRHEVSSRLRPLRDFFIVIFFIILGSNMIFSNIQDQLAPIIMLSLFVLIGNPLIVLILMRLFGYSTRTGFMLGLAIAQVSEFSLILIALGSSLGHISQDIASLVTMVALITIAGSTYMILYSGSIYSKLSPYLKVFDSLGPKTSMDKANDSHQHDIILMGCNRIGLTLVESLRSKKKSVLVVDFNPDTIRRLKGMGVDCLYGDAGNLEFLDDISLHKAKMVLSTVPDTEINITLTQKTRKVNPRAIILVVSNQLRDSFRIYEAGASYVIMPHFIAANHTTAIIEEFAFNIDRFLKHKATHLAHLKNRKQLHEQGFPPTF